MVTLTPTYLSHGGMDDNVKMHESRATKPELKIQASISEPSSNPKLQVRLHLQCSRLCGRLPRHRGEKAVGGWRSRRRVAGAAVHRRRKVEVGKPVGLVVVEPGPLPAVDVHVAS